MFVEKLRNNWLFYSVDKQQRLCEKIRYAPDHANFTDELSKWTCNVTYYKNYH